EFEYLYFFWKPGITLIDRKRLTQEEWVEWGSRAVWTIPSVRANDDHEAKFPIELPRRVIRLLTAPQDTVLDCFIGSGTTAIAAIREGRNYIGIELQPDYVALARKACAEEHQKEAFLNEARVPDGSQRDRSIQLALLEEKQEYAINQAYGGD